MKIFLSLLGAVFLTAPVFGQNFLTIQQKDGQEFSFGFEDKPIITYTDNDLVLKTSKTELQYPLASLAKFTFTDTATEVDAVQDDIKNPTFTIDGYEINITGTKAGINVSVISTDGKAIGTYKTDQDGSVSFSIADLSLGIYIIKSENLTFKVLKK